MLAGPRVGSKEKHWRKASRNVVRWGNFSRYKCFMYIHLPRQSSEDTFFASRVKEEDEVSFAAGTNFPTKSMKSRSTPRKNSPRSPQPTDEDDDGDAETLLATLYRSPKV
mmetsp:Transcript_17556/g.35890  ORF Transcript_17556/g.35890 Transcript_17556/m.35890 type:complete len:110 (+) Transcript_17556:576-905(+)